MFFSRLAIAALSLGSVAKVFAAPIVVDVAPIAKLEVGVERRFDLTLAGVVAIATGTLQTVKGEVDSLVKDPVGIVQNEVASVMGKFAPALKPVTDLLQTAGIKPSDLLLDVDGVTQLTHDVLAADLTDMLNVVNGVLTVCKGLPSVDLKAELIDIKDELTTLQTTLGSVLPEVLTIVGPVLEKVLGLVGEVLNLVLGVVGGLLGSVVRTV